MSLFTHKVNSYLGIDIGSASVKMLELEARAGKPALVNYGFAERVQGTGEDEGLSLNKSDDAIFKSAEIIREIYHKTGFKTKNVIAALHDFDVFTSVISLPSTNFKELENVINLEARKFVPISLEDVVLDWKIVNQNGRQGNNDKQKEKDKIKEIKKDVDLDVLLTAAPRNLIKKYIEIFKSAELNLLSLETEAFAFIRALLDENDTSSLMIIDVGAVASDIIIVENQIPVVIRSIDVGGASITKAIARNLGIGFERAEQFKRDIGIYSIGNVEDNLSDQSVLRVIESTFAPVINEIHYSLDLYKTKNKSMEKIILSGGSAYLSGLADFLKSILNLPVHIGDPWYKVAYPKEMEGALKEIGSMFTVAIGLALKEIVE